jgi:hypothetical protein
MPGSEPKLRVSQQSALTYFVYDPGYEDLFKYFTYRVQETNGPIGRGQCRILPRFKDSDQTSVLPHSREVMDEENGIEDLDQDGYRSLWEMHQGPVR